MRFHRLEEFLRTKAGAFLMGANEGSSDFPGLVSKAQKFYCGNVSSLPASSPENFPRLPYDMCVFEMEDVGPNGKIYPFFVLAEEVSNHLLRIHSFVPVSIQENFWLHNGWMDFDRTTNTYSTFVNKRTIQFLGPVDGDLKSIAGIQEVEKSVVATCKWLEIFLNALNCSNVEIVRIERPVKVNKKRAEQKKLPLYSYNILELKNKKRNGSLASSADERSGLRIHLR
jgi:hypothetical protein